ncbi:MAG: hypothetical protein B7Z66_00905 [Chromatiales bacterium 21-64-14]|nr:MAG: hypothetical protein B7Z66_00905 [Chromatiales bacterium 21-64-14]HQU16913.1 phosphate/phosphite/phosphonate ABC transporter substrate-binding protein [Gammaproteobacteria bacterium]
MDGESLCAGRCSAHWRFAVVLRLLLTALLLQASVAVAQETVESRERRVYRLAVFPYLSPLRLEPLFAPMAAEFRRVLGREVRLVTRSSDARFRAALDREAFAVVFVQPFDYVWLADRLGYRPLARSARDLEALFVVRAEASASGLRDFRGQVIAFPPAASAVTRLALAALRQVGLQPQRDFQPRYDSTHWACMRSLMAGWARACVTAASPLDLYRDHARHPVRVIFRSPSIPGPLFAAHPRVSLQERARLRAEIVSWGRSEPGRRILTGGRFPGFVPAADSDYESVRRFPGDLHGGG